MGGDSSWECCRLAIDLADYEKGAPFDGDYDAALRAYLAGLEL